MTKETKDKDKDQTWTRGWRSNTKAKTTTKPENDGEKAFRDKMEIMKVQVHFAYRK